MKTELIKLDLELGGTPGKAPEFVCLGKPAIVQAGSKHLHVVCMLGPLTVIKLPLTDEAYSKPLLLRGKLYPRKRAQKIFRRYGRRFGCSKAAKRIINDLTD